MCERLPLFVFPIPLLIYFPRFLNLRFKKDNIEISKMLDFLEGNDMLLILLAVGVFIFFTGVVAVMLFFLHGQQKQQRKLKDLHKEHKAEADK